MTTFKIGDIIFFSDTSPTDGYIGEILGKMSKKEMGYPTKILEYTPESNGVWEKWFNDKIYYVSDDWKICHKVDYRTQLSKIINTIYEKEIKSNEKSIRRGSKQIK